MTDKIEATHLERKATIYLRQSTLQQVREHPESTARQYALQHRAVELGWSKDSVDVIDEDLGQSGSRTQGRRGAPAFNDWLRTWQMDASGPSSHSRSLGWRALRRTGIG